jgi:hypothetical protein
MFRYIQRAVLAAVIVLLLIAACTDRGKNLPNQPELSEWAPTNLTNVIVSPFFRFQINNVSEELGMRMYLPQAAYDPPLGEGKRVPVLYLLAPQDGSEDYFFDHGLFTLAREMEARGEIQPMAIVTIASDIIFGGYFYGNSHPAGFYDSIFSQYLIGDAYTYWVSVKDRFFIDDPDKRGIGGTGMGAYGAFRAAIKNPGQFKSITVTDGPLDFDGATGSSGLMELFDDCMNEQGLTATSYRTFDTMPNWYISRMFVGGAFAFSPHDTAIPEYTIFYRDSVPFPGDTIHVGIDSIRIDSIASRTDSTTLITALTVGGKNFDFHLPFDSTAVTAGASAAYMPIWSQWMQNNLDSIHKQVADTTATPPLQGVNIWVGSSPDSRTGLTSRTFYDQTQSWVATLRAAGYDVDTYQYTGYSGFPAANDEFLYDVLREMLIYHSERFGD